jgi:hypothetical protein
VEIARPPGPPDRQDEPYGELCFQVAYTSRLLDFVLYTAGNMS